MAESVPAPSFERVPNSQRPIVIESYCRACGLLIGASADPYALTRAELEHTCLEWMKVY